MAKVAPIRARWQRITGRFKRSRALWGAFGVAIVLFLSPPMVRAESDDSSSISTPPPVSGRQLETKASIKAADVLARIHLIHDNLELIRNYMGNPKVATPIFQASGVTNAEAYFSGLNLKRRALRLGFEQLRVEQKFGEDVPESPDAHDTFVVMNEILVIVLQVKDFFGIDATVVESVQSEQTTMTEVLNQMLNTASLMSALLEKKTSAADVYYVLTIAVTQAMELHQKYSRELMPDEPRFVPGKNPDQVLSELQVVYKNLKHFSGSLDVPMCSVDELELKQDASSDDVFEFALLVVAQIDRVFKSQGIERSTLLSPGTFGRKFPAHTFQRAKHLESIISEVVDGAKSRAR